MEQKKKLIEVEECPECGGVGELQDGEEIYVCPVCNGEGVVPTLPE